MKVHIKNFQSVEDCEIDIDGLTVLVGKSNIGKSAIIRAVQGALTNREGESFVTDGAGHTEVHLQTPTLDLLWKKGGGFNDYHINGEVLENVNRGAPPHVAEAGFGELEVGRESISVQVADQFHPLFLLDATGSLAAEAISDVGRLTELQAALRNCDKDRREVRATLKVREKDLKTTQNELISFEGFEEGLAKDIAGLEATYKQCEALESLIESLSWFDRKRATFQAQIEALEGVGDVPIVPWDDEGLRRGIQHLETMNTRLGRCTETLLKFKGVEDITLPDWDTSEIQAEIVTLEGFSTRSNKLEELVSTLEGVEHLEVPSFDETALSEIQFLSRMAQGLEKASSIIPSLRREIQELEDQLEENHLKVHEVLVDAGQCPTCEQEVS